MARTPDPDGLTRASISGSSGYAVMNKLPIDEAVKLLTESATQTWTEGRGRERRTRSRLRLDLMSQEAGSFKAAAEHSHGHWAPLQHDLLAKVIPVLGELDQDAFQRGYDTTAAVYARPYSPGIGNGAAVYKQPRPYTWLLLALRRPDGHAVEPDRPGCVGLRDAVLLDQ